MLDATNSMTLPLGSRTRMEVLKEAALLLVDVIMDPPNQGGGIGIVPFALRVNLSGVSLGGPASTWIDVPPDDTRPAPGATPAGCSASGMVLHAMCLDRNAPGCVETNCRQVSWAGCTSYRPRSATSADLAQSFRTILADQNVAGRRHRGVIASASSCAPVTRRISTNKSTVVNRINALGTVSVETHIPAGLMWGWNMLTPELPIAGPPKEDVEDKGGKRAIILISDGENVNRPSNFGQWHLHDLAVRSNDRQISRTIPTELTEATLHQHQEFNQRSSYRDLYGADRPAVPKHGRSHEELREQRIHGLHRDHGQRPAREPSG